ncbi:peptidyl-prolyl cis-trans isomerase [Gemmata sp. G18]|uniref:Peptidyl-prolyl cis-trans isomerase n=1 Tax=Gemmata palustris TaxID=2822762 RepID=A0ABS5BVC5_9BACT|nr:peptidyl-prolyl cis-trans isomerase [Gemmata palustris]MBP3957619.1 peptidyl-prolyl cis-trans isomerase [Gemmata palustris]
MDAANPLCRCLLLAAGLVAVIGCQSDKGSRIARGQFPQAADPIAPGAPIAPPAPAVPVPGSPVSSLPADPLGPIAPARPTDLAPVVPAVVGAVAGSPVPPGPNGPIEKASAVGGIRNIATATDLLRTSVPRIKVVAIVGANNVITDQEVIEAVYQQYRELAALEGAARTAKQKQMYAQVLRKTIERELVLDDMYAKLKKANKMNVIDEIKEFATQSTDRQMRMIRTESGAKSDEEFAAVLRAQGLTVQVLRRQFERQMMAEQYISSALREKTRRAGLGEIRDYYDRHPDQFQAADRVKWQHLFVAVKNYKTPQDAQQHATGLWQKASAGADFGELAVKFDEGLAKQQKGFGTGEKHNEIQPVDVESTVWSLKPGQVSGVIQTPTGYHIVKVAERDYAGVQPFDTAVQSKIREKLTKNIMDTEYKKLVEELWRKNSVYVFPE